MNTHLNFSFRPGQKQFIWKITETVLISALFVALLYFFRPDDPLFITGPFPWILIAPILIGLLYGLSYGVVALGIIFIGLYYFEPSPLLQTDVARYYLLGCIIVTLICGEFSSFWRVRIARIEDINRYIQERIDSISRSYYAVRLSHDRLEQGLITNPVTLRSALLELRREILQHPTPLDAETVKRILALIAQYCSIDKAGLFLMEGSKIQQTPIGLIGAGTTLNKDDPLLKACLENPATLYRAVNEMRDEQRSQYAAITPLLTSDNQLLGLLLIEQISFWALNHETLESLAVLMAYFADDVSAYNEGENLLSKYPECPIEFAAELQKLIHLKQKMNVDSSLVGFKIDKEYRHYNLIFEMSRQRRGLDYTWQTTLDNDDLLIVLLPLAGPSNVDGYIDRMRNLLKEQFGIGEWGNKITVRMIRIYDASAADILTDMFKILKK